MNCKTGCQGSNMFILTRTYSAIISLYSYTSSGKSTEKVLVKSKSVSTKYYSIKGQKAS